MDDLVKAALAKWPNVPAVYGWLSLTARGEWRIKGEPIENAAIRAFIGRNYASDAGRWYFQNGPQRVYVSLDLAPFIYRIDEVGRLIAHNEAQPRELRSVVVDETGRLYFQTDLGPGALDDRELLAISARIVDRQGVQLGDDRLENWGAVEQEAYLETLGLHLQSEEACRIEHIDAARIAEVLGFVREPQSALG